MSLERSTNRKAVSRTSRNGGPHLSLDRRLHPRRPAVDDRIWVGGWVSGHSFTTVAARVQNISRGGARILSPIPFPPETDVWIKLGGGGYEGCLRAEVLEVVAIPTGDYVSRLRFHEECPDPFFTMVTRGRLP